jgi:hypothetical protein
MTVRRCVDNAVSRRRFLASIGALGALSLPGRSVKALADKALMGATTPVKNRAPLQPGAFVTLPLGSIRPAGWLREQLTIQAHGLSGHLDETWTDVGPNSGWLGGTGESWERGPYYLDGLVPLAYLLDDAGLKEKAQRYLEWTLNHASTDGMIGPKSNNDWWPRMVMAKALTQYQEATGDPRVVPVLSKYFAYQLSSLPERPLRDWGKYRWHDEALSVVWLYNRTGDAQLLELFRKLSEQGYDWQAEFTNFRFTQRTTPESIALKENASLTERGMQTHGVNVAMAIKMPSVRWLLTGKAADRAGVNMMLQKLYAYHGLPNGIFSADEHLAGLNPSQGTELCTVVETMFSLEHALAITGDAALADRLEKLAFNALPGTFTDDMWAHQYNQQPNQIVVSLQKEPWTTDGPESNLYGLDPNFGCCTANFSQGWPKFCASLFMLSADDGLAAAAYAPCEVNAVVRNTVVQVREETAYPFDGRIRVTVNPASPVEFPLSLRIPSWTSHAGVKVNSTAVRPSEPGSFCRVERKWAAGDVVEIEFPLVPRASRGFHDSVTVERGPLVFSYGIGEDWLKLRDRGMTADWQVYPTTPWNYAIDARPENIKVVPVEGATASSGPFTKKGTSVKLEVKGRRMPGWLSQDNVADPVPPSPATSAEPEETVVLIPYAAAKLRITAFPALGS